MKGTTANRFVVLDIKEFTTAAVPEADRYKVTRGRGLISLSVARGTLPDRCLRTHQCAESWETSEGGRLFAEQCALCGMDCWRGELVSRRPILVNVHDKGEFVPIRHDFPVRHVMAMANAAEWP